MRSGRQGVVLLIVIGAALAAIAPKQGSSAKQQQHGTGSLFVKATYREREPVFSYNFVIDKLRRGGTTGEIGSAMLDSIPAGTWVIHSGVLPNPWQDDTLEFVAGQQETLWVDIFAWAPPSGLDLVVDKRTGEIVDTSRPDTASKYQRRLKP